MDFSQRMGFRTAAKIIQVDEIDDDLRIGLWNAVFTHYLGRFAHRYVGSTATRGSNMEEFMSAIHSRYFKERLDQLPVLYSAMVEKLSDIFEEDHWHRVYSFIEFTAAHGPNFNSEYDEFSTADEFIAECNQTLQLESSAFRIVNGLVTQITDENEIAEIDRALIVSDEYAGVKTHLQTALAMLTDRDKPDYRNSIKESISAVESLAKHLTGNPRTTLAPALSELEKHHDLHPALKSAFSSLYGWTSNADGIRHALMDVSELTHADARWMLISCSAFINFAIDSAKG
ncbi:AbiJ-NTD4 domain-containing protein [Pseudomonas sp. PAMC 26793]|uniref:AbiJ-NTD4 domain-containing protein n=1 Tax=Pseudomonas sp. PAMC 26793 TaxID=1240676 RepID=UPI0003614961|nr:hypothetical protein [Pseudomonas sp. PAMC 26793]